MEFTFMYPVKLLAVDGLPFIANELEVKVTLERADWRDKDDFNISGLYAAMLCGYGWLEVAKDSKGYKLITDYLEDNIDLKNDLTEAWSAYVRQPRETEREVA